MKKIVVIQIILVVATAIIVAYVMKRDSTPLIPATIVSYTQPLVATSTFMREMPSSALRLINPAVVTDLGKHYIINFKSLRDEYVGIQSRYNNKTFIYFLYLNNGAWIGINEKEAFTAASTLKVPLAMTLMKAVEDKKLSLDNSYSLDKLNLDSNFGVLYKVGPDKEFKVNDLLKIMLEQSDNTAMNGLFQVLNFVGINDPLGDIYNTLGWELEQDVPVLGEPVDYSKINLKTLSNMFLALYNAKHNTIKDSEIILEYLASSPFNDKIVAGVPDTVEVSHKIGTAAPQSTYSDCGIVYVPERHYLLCIGSSGVDEKVAARFMSDVSKSTYKYVINN